MRRRAVLVFAIAFTVVVLAALAAPKKGTLPVLEWAAKSKGNPAPVAVLIEMGLKDTVPTVWNSKAVVKGAKVVHREGYRFRAADKLVDPDGWTASSRYGLRVPQRQPAVRALEGIATIGVVLHLSDVTDDATLTVSPRPESEGKDETIALKDVVSGTTKPLWGGDAVVRRVSTAAPVADGKTEDDFPAAAHGPDGTLWIAYVGYHLRDESRRTESNQLEKQPDDFKAFDTPGFGDQLFVRSLRDGTWSPPIAVTGPAEDLVRCAVAVTAEGEAWVVYSANRQGNFDLYARRLNPRVGEEVRLTKGAGPDLTPVACTAADGSVWVAYQSWDADGAHIALLHLDGKKWTDGPTLPGFKKAENRWSPALAAGPNGAVAVGYDVYRDGDYDVHVAVVENGKATDQAVAATARFEARPSLAYDASGRLWVACEDGPPDWGKDYGAQDGNDGHPLYDSRGVKVLCLADGKWQRPTAELPAFENKAPSLPFEGQVGPTYERGKRHNNPRLGLDGKGRLWLAYREKGGSRYTTNPGSYWRNLARRLDGDRWTDPVELHHSDGMLDSRPVVLPDAGGGVLVVHNTDGRYTTPQQVNNQVYLSRLDLPGEAKEPKLAPHEPKGEKHAQRHEKERAAVKQIRDYRVEAGGKNYRLLRGEFHRHTAISADGGPDGSLEDLFRYGLDAAAMDWIGNGDHDNGGGREYTWWLIQKLTDAYHVSSTFTPMFTYERSVGYPHGHRNCVFARRGIRTLPRLRQPDADKAVANVHADDTKMLYRYLRELDGICASHTSATTMGTDWRDNDPKVEPFVEIYQGDRMSYEYEEAPRAGYEQGKGKTPVNIAGWRPLGFVKNALEKGYRLGFQASSDHWSTHISYCVVLAERHDRKGIHDAMKARHCYGATDAIVVDVRSGAHVMGDEFRTAKPPSFDVTVLGTGAIEQVDVLRDSVVVDTLKPGKREHKATWTDPKPAKGTHWYYVRVVQTDGEMAWASPMWVEYAP